jgi:Ca2+-binding RTX toxin-like protein
LIDILNVTNAAELNNQQVTAMVVDDDKTPIRDTALDDNLTGTPNNDTIALTGGNNIVRANNGNDMITGAAGSDRFYGDPGSDVQGRRSGR